MNMKQGITDDNVESTKVHFIPANLTEVPFRLREFIGQLQIAGKT